MSSYFCSSGNFFTLSNPRSARSCGSLGCDHLPSYMTCPRPRNKDYILPLYESEGTPQQQVRQSRKSNPKFLRCCWLPCPALLSASLETRNLCPVRGNQICLREAAYDVSAQRHRLGELSDELRTVAGLRPGARLPTLVGSAVRGRRRLLANRHLGSVVARNPHAQQRVGLQAGSVGLEARSIQTRLV